MERRDRAKQVLVFYFQQVMEATGLQMEYESQLEIEAMIDWIIDDAVEVAVDESLTTVIDALKGTRADER